MDISEVKNIITDKIAQAISNLYQKDLKELTLGFPPDLQLGDFAFGCFSLAKELKKNPAEIAKAIAQNIVKNLRPEGVLAQVSAFGPYLNFKVKNQILFNAIAKDIADENFGTSKIGQGEKVMVEYLSPNTNKPLHLGHVRNGALGMAISNLFENAGYKVVKANLINDRGIHICKSMLAWKKWGNGETPESVKMKGDHFVGKWYVRYAEEAEKNPALENEIQEMLVKWEARDPEIIALWEKMNSWVYAGFEETYKKLGLVFDTIYYESETYKLGKEIVKKALKDGIFTKQDDGAVIATFPPEFGLDQSGNQKKITLLRTDGTSVYITQDLGTAVKKFSDYNLDRSIYVVGSEQEYHFKCLFTLLEMLGFPWARECYHLSYGMVYLPEGKMKSREGKIVDADDLISSMQELAREEIRSRDLEYTLSDQEVNERALKIGLAAIKFYLLKVGPRQDIHFNPKESISFDGATGPFCQYAYARASGILRNAKGKGITFEDYDDFSDLGSEEELNLAQKIIQFPMEVEKGVLEFNPSGIATITFEISQAFNHFYQNQPVLSAENENLIKSRLALVAATMVAVKKGLNLLGIEVLEKM